MYTGLRLLYFSLVPSNGHLALHAVPVLEGRHWSSVALLLTLVQTSPLRLTFTLVISLRLQQASCPLVCERTVSAEKCAAT